MTMMMLKLRKESAFETFLCLCTLRLFVSRDKMAFGAGGPRWDFSYASKYYTSTFAIGHGYSRIRYSYLAKTTLGRAIKLAYY